MQHNPPPLFKQGPSALMRFVCLVMLAGAMLVADTHFSTPKKIRSVIGTALYPVQHLMLVPRKALSDMATYFLAKGRLRSENTHLRVRNLQLSLRAQQTDQLQAENQYLRQLLV